MRQSPITQATGSTPMMHERQRGDRHPRPPNATMKQAEGFALAMT
jgi:hypothetical protein